MKKVLFTLLGLFLAVPALAAAVADSTGVTLPSPAPAQAWFDAHAVLIVLAFGLVWKFLPALKAWTNELIPWIGLVGYVLTALVGAHAPGTAAAVLTGIPAHASFWSVLGHGALNVVGAVGGFEGLARPLLNMLGVKKP